MVKMNSNIFFIVFGAILLLTSCKTKDRVSDLNYMQNVEQIATEAAVNNSASTIQKGDQFVILVTAKDMAVVKPFNQNYSSGEISQYSIPSSNVATQGQENVSGPTYIVDGDGIIDFPVLGKMVASGKTMVEFKDELRNQLRRFVKDPTVTMRFTNYKVTILGEVNKPGQYVIPDGQSTLLNALGLAGDLTIYGKRNDVLLVRSENGNVTKERLNLMDANFINSPYYHLKQGDVIYVSANETKEKTARLDPHTGTYIAIAGTLIGLAGIFITIFKK